MGVQMGRVTNLRHVGLGLIWETEFTIFVFKILSHMLSLYAIYLTLLLNSPGIISQTLLEEININCSKDENLHPKSRFYL